MKPLDPALSAIADAIRASGGPSLFDLPPNQARAIFDQIAKARPTPDDGVTSRDVHASSETGGLRLRIYQPRRNAVGATTVFLHGGGYMLGGVEQMDNEARLVCAGAQSVVVSVDYRLAPEHRLPAAHFDAVAALDWALRHAPQLGGDAAKLAVAGESAGANLAASAAIAMRDRGVRLSAQLLIVPAPDLAAARSLPDADVEYPMLTCRDMRAIAQICLPDPDAGAAFPCSAAHAANLEGLPPAVIGLAGHCPARDIGRDFAMRLSAAGNEVHLHEFDDMFHPFFAFAAASERAMAAADLLLAEFRSMLSR